MEQYQGDRAKFEDIVGLLKFSRYRPGVMNIEPRGVKKKGDMQLGDIQNDLMQKTSMKAWR